MKFKFLFLCLFGMMLISCGDDDSEQEQEVNCDDLSALLIGQWESDENPGTTVEFKSGNTVIDDGFLFIDDDFPEGSELVKTYKGMIH